VNLERQAQALQEFAAVARGRGKNHLTLHGVIVRERFRLTG
jgi:hypothetical protein